MAETTNIAWCDATFNPWIGCTKISPGCENCYAERDFDHRRHVAQWGAGRPRIRTSAQNWKKPLAWNRKAQRENRILKVFSGSLCDVFDAEIQDAWRDDLFDLINATSSLTWLLLTKRPAEAQRYFESRDARFGVHESRANICLGTTVCNQDEAGRNIPVLCEIPCPIHFVSVEPMLGPIDLTDFMQCGVIDSMKPKLDWVICGGETGPNARPMHPDWPRHLRNQCNEKQVPFFFKQWNRKGDDILDGKQYHEFPKALR